MGYDDKSLKSDNACSPIHLMNLDDCGDNIGDIEHRTLNSTEQEQAPDPSCQLPPVPPAE